MGVSLQIYRVRIAVRVKTAYNWIALDFEPLTIMEITVQLSTMLPIPVRGVFTCQTNLNLRQPARCWNSFMKATNGNRSNKGRGIKLIAWNKGSSHLQNKHHEIENIIAAEKPHIVGLSEANLKQGTDLSLVQHEEYTLHTAPTMENPQLRISRMVVYTHSSLVVKRRAWKTSHYLLSG